ncbi:PLP-dependent aminotransferase family protein [Cohnella terricola]|uniref:PLP-dependent aminotransferase family protein n=1 Tax=Cohnella terricola TaxID=1289167 RepID=A0A559JDH3_9BACL|nr:PLP-dependent aminotransferase family protein [Cohnella terricola]TVX97917.1 PLP-dependent aminotransferase family protein [Cohnella terricola]
MNSPFAYTVKLAECSNKHMAMYLAIREAITEGKLAPGEKLPSTRRLAELYDLSRGSVSLAYEMLTAEGFVRAGVGQGTFVAGGGSEFPTDRSGKETSGTENRHSAAPAITKWGCRLLSLEPTAARQSVNSSDLTGMGNIVSFSPEGIGARFPWAEWRSEVTRQWRSLGTSARSGDLPTAGSLELRKAIANRLRRERGISCREEDIVITAGSMQAIALLTQLLLEEGKTAVIENPCYTGIQNAAKATGASVIAQRLDASGIVPEDWDAELLFVTPTRQFPTGVVLSYDRRRALLAWASRRNAWIIEDDYDSDFRWGGRPIEPLKSLDKEDRVVYIGTFSRSMSLNMRIGFAVVPKQLMQHFILAKQLYDPYPTGIAEQQALASWMSAGGYDRHMRKMRRLLGKLENKLRANLERRFTGLFATVPSDAGLHVYTKWRRSPEEYEMLAEECRRRGVTWKDGTIYEVRDADRSLNPLSGPSAIFGFAHMNEKQIEEGIDRIAQAALSLKMIHSDKDQGGTVHA